MYVHKLTICGHNLVISIPKDVKERLNLKKGQYVKITIENGKIVIEPLKL